jgi:hypothetical protein
VGNRGQFDVVVDGQTIASRGGNLLTRAFGGGWPDEAAVVKAIDEKRAARSGS